MASDEGEKGFTLVELMVALALVGILVAVSVAVYIEATRRAKDVTCQSNLRILRSAIVVYRAANLQNPDSLNDLDPNFVRDVTGLSCPASNIPYSYNKEAAEVKCEYQPHASY